MFRKLAWRFSLLLLAVMVIPIFAGNEPAAAEREKLTSHEVIAQALAKKTEVNFNETPLADIVSYLQERYKIPVQLDRKGLEEEGATLETPISLQVSGISVKSALHLMLHPLHLCATIQDEVLLITSEQVADGNVRTVVYNVTDLISPKNAAVSSNAESPLDNATVPIQFGGGVKKTEPPESVFNPLIDVITRTIAPTSWDSVGGPGAIQPFETGGIRTIVVMQTEEIHEKIADLLSQLRALRHKGEIAANASPF